MTAHPEFAAHGSFAHLKLGRNPRRVDHRTLELARYVTDRETFLSQIPETFDERANVSAWPMYDNDTLGDCTIAAAGHMIEEWTAAAGDPKLPSEGDIEIGYWETGDPPATTGVPSGPTDTGRDEISVLNYWRQTGFGGDKIQVYTSITPTDHDILRAALYLFGGVYTGVSLPLTAQTQAEWDVGGDPTDQNGPAYPGSWGGHAVPNRPVWDGQTLEVVTWGATLRMTLAFSDAYVEEIYAVLSPDWFNGTKAANGLDTDALQADLAQLG